MSMVGNIVDASFKLLGWLGSGLGDDGEDEKQRSKQEQMRHQMNLKRMEALTAKMGQGGPFSTDMAQQKAQVAGAMTTQRTGQSQVASAPGPGLYDLLKQAKQKAFED